MIHCTNCGAPNPERLNVCYACKADLGSHTHDPQIPTKQDHPQTLFYVETRGEKRGPYLTSQIQSMWNTGQLTADALYWCEGMADWASIAQLITSPEDPDLPGGPAKSPNQARYNPETDTFRATLPLMVKLAMRAVQDLGWKLENVNESVGLVTFQTGISWGSWSGISCSLNIEEVARSTFRVSGVGRQNPSGAIRISVDVFGEASAKANKAIDRMKRLAE